MTTPEDRLAALLREQAETLTPGADGLAKIQARVASRRRTRWFVVPSAAVAAAVAVTSFFVFSGPDDKSSLTQVGGPSPSASPYFCYQPVADGPCPTPQTSPSAGLVGQAFVAAIWPFASHDQAQAWRHDTSSMPWAADNLGVAQHFVDDYLHLTGVHLVQTCVSCDVVGIVNADGHEVATIGLVREDDGSPRAYSVSGVYPASGFTVTSPAEGRQITSPATLTGRITGVDENISISLVTQTGRSIGTASTPSGSGAPWSTTISWTDQDWYTGALVLKTYSPKDGALNRLIVLRARRGA
ncbi:MAG: hypothetical protein JWP14_2859 [Frankiales bacterium]|nr:hypothetical protein [Frankiales bacterium]